MSQRPQRAAAVQAIKANTAALAPRRRSDSQTSSRTITSPHVKAEDRPPQEGRSSPSMDVMMQRSSHQDLRRIEAMAASGESSSYNCNSNSNSNMFPIYWSAQGDPSAAGTVEPQKSPGSAYHPQQFWDGPVPEQHNLSYHDHIPNHAGFDLHYGYDTQGNSLGLKADSGLHVGLNGDIDLNASMHRDQKSFDPSDSRDLLDSLPYTANSSADNDSYEDSTDSDLPPEKKKLSAAFRPRGRKKRNKCTPDQLRSLEAFFEKNRNPTGRIRHELSRRLRMPERSVQVWFQNRRAKVKTVERRGDTGSDSCKQKSCSTRLSEKDTYRPVGLNGRSARDAADQVPSVTAIPTSALCIGSWRRVSPLICFFSRRLQSMTWYLTSESIGFKLEIPWTSIRSAYFDGPTSPSIAERAEGVRVPLGQFVIDLERPPTFFMEVFRSAPIKNGTTEEPKVSWRQCEDFTEDHQAMTVSRHILNGPYEELRSAVEALARCNDVLHKLIEFRDTKRRATGDIPTGSGSTADNFGLTHNSGVRPMDPLASPFDASTALAGVDAYGNPMQMPMQSAAMSSTSSLSKSATWHSFRAGRPGVEPGWEFDSPASVSTNLSEASLDSTQRHHVGYSPYGVASSIEASPRSGLGSSVDLGALRLDSGGISNFSASVPMGPEGAFDSRHSFEGYLNRLNYEMPAPPVDTQFAVAGQGVANGGQGQSQGMQNSGLDPNFGMGQLGTYDRSGEDRQDYSSQANTGGLGNGQHHAGSSMPDLSRTHDGYHLNYEGHNTSHDYQAGGSCSLLMSRRFSHADASTHGDNPGNCQQNDSDPSARRPSLDQRPSSASQLAPPNDRLATTFDEDAFSGKTPTHRTSFGNSLQLSQMSDAQDGSSNRYTGSTLVAPSNGYESDGKETAQGRARSNTYKSSTHGGRAAVSSPLAMQRLDSEQGRPVSSSGEGDRGGEGGGRSPPVGNNPTSPGLLSLSGRDVGGGRERGSSPGSTTNSNGDRANDSK
ncbi:hypothetical protein NDA13_000147 [Ustilago tritici]|nr:hypothetical protein NDA13_000147 [Ustilago tritici]